MKKNCIILGLILIISVNCSSDKETIKEPQVTLKPQAEDIYTGALKKGKRHGKGTLVQGDGVRYVGEFKEGEFDGKGTLTKPDGTEYVGDFKKGLFHGRGKFTSAEREVFEGEFFEGKFIKRQIVRPEDILN